MEYKLSVGRPEEHLPLLTEGRGDSLGYRGHKDEQTFRSRAGHVGHVATENSGTGAHERLRGGPAAEASVRRRVAGERRIAVPGAAQVGTRGLDYSRVENVRVWPAGEILFTDTTGAATARKRSR